MEIGGSLLLSTATISSGCFVSSTQNLFRQQQRPFSAQSTLFSTTMAVAPRTQNPNINSKLQMGSVSKRKFCLSILLGFPSTAISVILSAPSTVTAAEEQQLLFERYTDANEGFTLLRPSSWIKVDKAGATVLFEEANKGTNNVGVVVSPVRLSSLAEFGSPQFAADKLILAEKRKESTKDAEVIGVAERLGHGGLPVYEFEYKVDSTRGGIKRIFSAAFVSSKKLYLLNITYSDRPENPIDTGTRMMLEQVLHSFDTASSK